MAASQSTRRLSDVMDGTEKQTSQDKSKHGFTAVNSSYLQTPPTVTGDSFSHNDDTHIVQGRQRVSHPRTPPESPYETVLPANADTFPTNDVPIFRDGLTGRKEALTPLFAAEPPSPAQPPAGGNSRSNSLPPVSEFFDVADQAPKPVESKSDLTPWSYVRNAALKDRELGRPLALDYFHSRIGELEAQRAPRTTPIMLPEPRQSRSSNLDDYTKVQLARMAAKPTGITKPKPSTRQKTPATPPSPHAASSSPPKRRRAPKAKTSSAFLSQAWPPATHQAKHTRGPPTKKNDNPSLTWRDLPDYTPPLTSLDALPAKALKVNWKGNPTDLSTDPDRDYLHPQELHIASLLRLSCAQYLTNKRKIFAARVAGLKAGKAFTKTAAQSSCAMDVNKASQLWEAFERVGWFGEGWFREYL